MSHAELGASNAHRWMNCAGSVNAERGKEDRGSKYAAEGTRAHELAEEAFRKGRDPTDLIDTYTGDTEEMADAVRLYLNIVRGFAEQLDWSYVEQKFDLGPLGTPGPMFGTADFAGGKGKLLVVADLKYGKGVTVSAEDNPQTKYYALGAWVDLALRDRAAADAVQNVRMVIVQPRVLDAEGEPSVSISDIPIAELRAWAKEMLKAAAATQEPDAPRTAGEHCKFCKAKAECPEFRGVALSTIPGGLDFEALPVSLPPAPAGLTPEQLGRILELKPVLTEWLAACEAQAFTFMEEETAVPGWSRKPKRATRKWANPDETIGWLEAEGADAQAYLDEPKLKSPARIEKLVGKGRIPEALVVAESSGLTLCRDTDPKAVPLGALDTFDAFPAETPST